MTMMLLVNEGDKYKDKDIVNLKCGAPLVGKIKITIKIQMWPGLGKIKIKMWPGLGKIKIKMQMWPGVGNFGEVRLGKDIRSETKWVKILPQHL